MAASNVIIDPAIAITATITPEKLILLVNADKSTSPALLTASSAKAPTEDKAKVEATKIFVHKEEYLDILLISYIKHVLPCELIDPTQKKKNITS
ncbi:hypothetical protein XBO1_1300110 [Xenorhabdus bovienii str. oregonense]|uniref:Uncharacterized protein n=1 Tax=Xenorhabdus bovienii str. oregonense TaxID=1398202 RepID=A0A077P3S9_XENBV|nr:hypothetical protein XBO1_1300110 [Xenorhabdus bovienii str. oregonense]